MTGEVRAWQDPSSDVARPPLYVDAALDDFQGMAPGQFHHLGHWTDPSSRSLVKRIDAQQVMNDIIVDMAGIENRQTVLDVGSGFGGTIAAIDSRFSEMQLVGLDIDQRQSAFCRGMLSKSDNSLSWVASNACEMPFREASFDRLISIEAMWHFPSRKQFLQDAARVLKDGATMALVDILIAENAELGLEMDMSRVVEILRDGFAPWPEPGASVEEILEDAASVGLHCSLIVDATDNTKPTYDDEGDGSKRPGTAELSSTEAVQLFVDMHKRDLLKVVYFRMERRPRVG